MRKAQEHDFAEFFHATWKRLYRTTYAITGDAGLTEDAVQIAFARAYAAWPRVSSATNREAYVRRIAVNEALGIRRRSWFQSERTSAEHTAERGEASHEDAVVAHDAMWRAVRDLPPRQRAIVVLRYYEDLNEAQIAEVLGCSRGTVKSQASAALANLRRLYAQPNLDARPNLDAQPNLNGA